MFLSPENFQSCIQIAVMGNFQQHEKKKNYIGKKEAPM